MNSRNNNLIYRIEVHNGNERRAQITKVLFVFHNNIVRLSRIARQAVSLLYFTTTCAFR